MKNLLILITSFLSLHSIADENYFYSINLTKVDNDKVSVMLTPPTFTQSEVEFCFPAMVPGTYEVYDFGRFISNFTATGKNGTKITVIKVDVNTYKLSPADQLDKISYNVDDTWDKTDLPNTKDKIVFEPGGTNIEDGKNFSINTHSMFGYFKNFTNKNFILEFQKPKGFYPVTGLSNIKLSDTKDVITVFDYHDLVDSPIMYSLPDTVTVQVSNTKVLVGCYSPNKKINANYIAGTLKELLNAQSDYLGGQLPVDKYAFIFYFIDKATLSGASGALEHSYSSFYVLPELDSTLLQQELRDVSAHEFFHIVTPLNIHAKQIGDFDFNNPQMSEHLWLYEGMTEYAAHHAQAKGGIINVDQLLNTMIQKYENSLSSFNDTMSFTWMSKNVLKDKIHPQYNNVYEKGALIGMCLDILLRDLSNGKYGTQNLMKDLATKYGKNKSFNDDDLFNDIEKFTYPEIGNFLKKHVSGHTPLPMIEVFSKIGITFEKELITNEFTIGGPDLDYNQETQRLVVMNISNMDAFGKSIGFKNGDELNMINGKLLKIDSVKEIMRNYFETVKEGDKVEFEIYRPKRKQGKYKVKKLQASAKKVTVVRKNQITLMENISDKQKQTLKAWLGL
ncbi:MAG: peptidase M61 [Bacteroidota bacterium]|nr:peptidase M61 [Bacteroidota bacterium]